MSHRQSQYYYRCCQNNFFEIFYSRKTIVVILTGKIDIMKKAAELHMGYNRSQRTNPHTIGVKVLIPVGWHKTHLNGGAAMYIGVDYHKKYSIATKMNEEGNIVEQVKLSNNPESLLRYFENLPPESKIALEATGSWYYFYELLEEKCPNIYLSHPLKTRAIAEARIKTDKIDSGILAHLLRANLLPTSYIPPREIRDVREVLRYRASLISLRTSIKNKIWAIISKNGISPKFSDIFCKSGIKYIKALNLRNCYREAVDGYLRIVEVLNCLIEEVGERIKGIVQDNREAKLLITIPGISYYSALLIVSEIGDVNRFSSARKLCSYAGLVPSVHSSGGKTRYGSITKQGSKWLRWILVELSHHFINSSKKMERMYLKVSKSHGKNAARVSVAREMLKVIYYMLRDNRPYRVEAE
jgi:transposase